HYLQTRGTHRTRMDGTQVRRAPLASGGVCVGTLGIWRSVRLHGCAATVAHGGVSARCRSFSIQAAQVSGGGLQRARHPLYVAHDRRRSLWPADYALHAASGAVSLDLARSDLSDCGCHIRGNEVPRQPCPHAAIPRAAIDPWRLQRELVSVLLTFLNVLHW